MFAGSPRIRIVATVMLVPLVLASGCSSGPGYEYVDDPGTPAPAAATGSQAPITAREVAGHWSSPDYGEAYIQISGTAMRMVYGTSQGRMVGSLTGGTFVGWWTEAPTRKAADDAGDATFTFVRVSGGKLSAQGKWRGGTTGDYETDWVMTKTDDVIPDGARAVFADPSQFLRHP